MVALALAGALLGAPATPALAAETCTAVWSEAATISLPGARVNIDPKVAVNSAGWAMAVWTEMDADDTEHVLTAQRPPGGAWLAPVEVAQTRPSVTSDEFPSEVGIALGDGGHAIVTWRRQTLGTVTRPWVATLNPVTGWSAPVDLAVPRERFQSAASVAVNAAGQGVVAWTSSTTVHVRLFEPASGWGTVRNLRTGATSDGPTEVRAALNAAGQVAVSWADPMPWVARIDPLQGAQAPRQLIADGSVDFRRGPELAVADNGSIFVTWSHLAPGADILQVLAAQYRTGSGWGAAQALSNPGVQAVEPDVAVNPQGDAVVAWNRLRPPNTRRLEGTRWLTGTGWSPARAISPNRNPLGDFSRPWVHLSASGVGTATAGWFGNGVFQLESYTRLRGAPGQPTVHTGLGGNNDASGAANETVAVSGVVRASTGDSLAVRVRDQVCTPTR